MATTTDKKKQHHQQQQAPRLPLKTRLYIAFLSFVNDAVCRPDGTINRRALRFLDTKTPPSATPRRGVRTLDLTINPSLFLRLFIPSSSPTTTPLPLILFFHGGGYAFLSASSWAYDAACRRIARKTCTILASLDYRLSPEHRYPAQYNDGLAALRFIAHGGLGDVNVAADLSSCFLAGDSAGANLAHHVAARWAAEPAPGQLRVAGIVAIQPWFGGEERTAAELRLARAPLVSVKRTDWLWRAFLPEGEDRDHPAVNVFGPRAEELPEGFPAAAVVVVGGYDPLQDWQRRYYEGLLERGVEARLVEFPDAIHAFYVFPELPDSGKLIDVINEFVETHRSPAGTVE